MNTKEKVIFCWSGGKDSALCLHYVLQSGRYDVVCLLTTLNEEFERISMHGVRSVLLEKQAEAIGLPLEKVFVSRGGSNAEYQERMESMMLKYKAKGVGSVVYGDIFLEDLRVWREGNLAKIGMKAVFPLWKRDTRELIGEFINLGFDSVICCVNDAWFGKEDVGRKIGTDFIESLPPNVDPCGENGEFHSFAFAGPIFKQPLHIQVGEKVWRPVDMIAGSNTSSHPGIPPGAKPTRGFWFCDLLPADANA